MLLAGRGCAAYYAVRRSRAFPGRLAETFYQDGSVAGHVTHIRARHRDFHRFISINIYRYRNGLGCQAGTIDIPGICPADDGECDSGLPVDPLSRRNTSLDNLIAIVDYKTKSRAWGTVKEVADLDPFAAKVASLWLGRTRG